MNYYVLLGITHDASHETIRRAFRTLVRRYHPDAGPDSSAERFRDIVRAYETLSDPARRRAYDRSLGVAASPPSTPVQPFAGRPIVPEPLIPPTPRRTVPYTRTVLMPDDLLEQMFARDLFAMLDSFFVRPRRW